MLRYFIFLLCLITASLSNAQEYIYGLTQHGGASAKGVAFRIKTDGTDFQKIGDFDGSNGAHPGYGASYTQISTGYFLGMSSYGGTTDNGAFFFSLPGSPGLTNIFPFSPGNFEFNGSDKGSHPEGALIEASNGLLYGTTSFGGWSDYGIAFSILNYGGAFTERIQFDYTTKGSFPKGGLIQASNGYLYGMNLLGGNGTGIIFRTDLKGQNFTNLFDFKNNDPNKGFQAYGSLLEGSDGMLYGMTRNGGANGKGVIFKIGLDGNGYQKLRDFDGANSGAYPYGSLIESYSGDLYGLTNDGGTSDNGVIFKIKKDGTGFVKIKDFNGTDGENPVGTLVQSKTGEIFGTASSGGVNAQGTIFKLQSGDVFTKLFDFNPGTAPATGRFPVGALILNRSGQTITFNPLQNKILGDAPVILSATSTAGLPVTFVSSDLSVATISGNVLTIVGGGPVNITAFQRGNQEFIQGFKTQSFTVSKIDQTITFDAIPEKTFGSGTFTLSASATSGLSVQFTSSSSLISITGNTVSILGTGTGSITASQAGNASYNSAATVDQSFTINKAAQTITFNSLPSKTYGNSPFSLSASSTSGLTVSFTGDPSVVTISGSSATIIGAGAADIIASQPGNANYLPATSVTRTLTVDKANQAVTVFNPLSAKNFTDIPFTIFAILSSGLPPAFTSNQSQVASVNGSLVTIVGAGSTFINAFHPGNNNYNPAPSTPRLLVVNPPATSGPDKIDQTITFNSFGVLSISDQTYFLLAKASSGLFIDYSTSNPLVATVSGNTLTMVGEGTCTITASQLGNSQYNPALSVSRTVTVTRGSQIISFNSISTKTFGDSPFALVASSSSGLPVSFTSSNTSVATVNGNVVTIQSGGTVSIIASQVGDNRYFAAPIFSRTLTVNRTTQAITFSTIASKAFGDAPFALQASSSSGLPVSFSSNNLGVATVVNDVLSIKAAGSVTITANQSGDGNYLSATNSQTITIAKANQVITFDAIPPKKFGAAAFTLTAVSSSGLPVSLATEKKTVIKLSGNTAIITNAGDVNIIASQPGNSNYNAATNVVQLASVTDLGITYDMWGTSRVGGNGEGTIYSLKSDGSDFHLTKNFENSLTSSPWGGLIKGDDGLLYGMHTLGGSQNMGSIFRVGSDGSQYQILHDFVGQEGRFPTGSLLKASNGSLYGVCLIGGTHGVGTLFKMNPDGSGFIKLYDFIESFGANTAPDLLQAADGNLYGITIAGGFYSYGVIFKIGLDGTGYTKVLEFNGAEKGAAPRGGLLQGADLYLYGVAAGGGVNGKGVVFKIKPDGSSFSKLVEFDGSAKGAAPFSITFGADGNLYGLTQSGGAGNLGSMFTVSTTGTGFAKLVDFNGAANGSGPTGKLVQSSGGFFYGVTFSGGTSDLGTLFKVKPDGSEFSKLLDFNRANGSRPQYGPMIEMSPGEIYGLASQGAASDAGVMFALKSDVYSVVKDFLQQEGRPAWINSIDGLSHYGLASSGGLYGYGSVFKVDAGGINYAKLEGINNQGVFNSVTWISPTPAGKLLGVGVDQLAGTSYMFTSNPDGTAFTKTYDIPSAFEFTTFFQSRDGDTYTTTKTGELYNRGAVFKLKNDGSGFSKVTDLQDGPIAYYMALVNGLFYGLAGEGGSKNSGAIYRLNPTGSWSKIFDLDKDESGTNPVGIIETSDGNLCISSRGGGAGAASGGGVLFTIAKDGTGYRKIVDFATATGNLPTWNLIQSAEGNIYGTTEIGGTSGFGVIYKVSLSGSGYSKIHEFNGTDGNSPNYLFFRKAEHHIIFDAISQKKATDQIFVPSAISTSGVPLQFSSSNPAVAIVINNVITLVGAGVTEITASVPENSNYFPTPAVSRTLTVVKDDQVVTFTKPADTTLGQSTFQLEASATSSLPMQFTTDSDKIEISGKTVKMVKAGPVTIKAVQPGNNLYNAALPVLQTFCVKPAKPIISESGLNNTLTSSSDLGNQWFLNGASLPGETNKNLLLKFPGGVYTVRVTIDGCVGEPSEQRSLVITGDLNNFNDNGLPIYPNPAHDEMILKLDGFEINEIVSLEIYDITGKSIQSTKARGQDNVRIDLRYYAPGVYLIKASQNASLKIVKFIKQ